MTKLRDEISQSVRMIAPRLWPAGIRYNVYFSLYDAGINPMIGQSPYRLSLNNSIIAEARVPTEPWERTGRCIGKIGPAYIAPGRYELKLEWWHAFGQTTYYDHVEKSIKIMKVRLGFINFLRNLLGKIGEGWKDSSGSLSFKGLTNSGKFGFKGRTGIAAWVYTECEIQNNEERENSDVSGVNVEYYNNEIKGNREGVVYKIFRRKSSQGAESETSWTEVGQGLVDGAGDFSIETPGVTPTDVTSRSITMYHKLIGMGNETFEPDKNPWERGSGWDLPEISIFRDKSFFIPNGSTAGLPSYIDEYRGLYAETRTIKIVGKLLNIGLGDDETGDKGWKQPQKGETVELYAKKGVLGYWPSTPIKSAVTFDDGSFAFDINAGELLASTGAAHREAIWFKLEKAESGSGDTDARIAKPVKVYTGIAPEVTMLVGLKNRKLRYHVDDPIPNFTGKFTVFDTRTDPETESYIEGVILNILQDGAIIGSVTTDKLGMFNFDPAGKVFTVAQVYTFEAEVVSSTSFAFPIGWLALKGGCSIDVKLIPSYLTTHVIGDAIPDEDYELKGRLRDSKGGLAGKKVHFAQIKGSLLGAAEIEIQLMETSTDKYIYLGWTTTLADGSFAFPVRFPEEGTVKVVAFFGGDSKYSSSKGFLYIVVRKRVSVITLNIPDRVYAVGDRISLAGMLSRVSMSGRVGLVSKEVKLNLDKKEYTTNTGPTGNYSSIINLDEKGMYAVSAEFEGDNSYYPIRTLPHLILVVEKRDGKFIDPWGGGHDSLAEMEDYINRRKDRESGTGTDPFWSLGWLWRRIRKRL